jgi:ammonium transporter, Amt family
MRRRQIVGIQTALTRLLYAGGGALGSILVMASQAEAQVAALKLDTGDTAWVLISSALVLVMVIPGLALFYGGLVRSKNVLGTIMQSFMILAVVSLMWVMFGYSLAFGPDKGGVIGGLDWVGLRGVGAEPHPSYGPTIPP